MNPAGQRAARRTAVVLILGAVAVVVVAGAVLLSRPPSDGAVARVVVEPGALLLTTVGETRQLRATAYDGAGLVVPNPAVTWTTSHAAAIAVDSAGLATALENGSSLLVAEVAGVRSQAALAIVTRPADGVTLVSDDQIMAGPVVIDSDATPSMANEYQVTLQGIEPAVGDVLIGTGAEALAGEVVGTASSGDGVVATMRLVPLPRLLPDLEIDETIELSAADVVIPDEIARLYDVTHDRTTYTFTPKPDFEQLVPTSPAAARPAGGPVAWAGAGSLLQIGPVGTTALPPFTECEADFTPSSTSLPIQLSTPPLFSVDIKPSLDIRRTPARGLERFVVKTAFEAKVDAGLEASVAFEGKVGCEVELFEFRIPVAGALSLLLAGVVPVKVGFEIGGKVTVAKMKLSTELKAETAAELGIVCPAGGDCAVHRETADIKVDLKPTLDGPDLADLRVEPSIEVFGGLDLEIGSPFLKKLRFEAVEAKVGAKLAADWSMQRFQILDSNYASNYKLTLEAGASIGTGIEGIANYLGISSLTALELKISTDLASSPSGQLTTDRPQYVTGDAGTATVKLDAAALEFLGIYQVHRVLLVHDVGGTVTTLASANAAAGQAEFSLPFQAADPISAADLYAFVVTIVAPLDLFALELGKDAGPITCSGDPTTIQSIEDTPDNIWVVFDGGSTCRLVAEAGQSDPNEDNPDIVLSIDADPGETVWDAGLRGANWGKVGGFGENLSPGTQTVRVEHLATGRLFDITVSVDVSLIGGGQNVTMTVRDATITPLP